MRIVGIVTPGAALGGRAAARCQRSFLAVIFAAKATIAFALYSIGFAGVSADEYARSILAMEWAHNPYLVVGQTAWLPFELYIDGSLLRLIPDPLWLPRFTIFIASCLVILFFFKLVRLLFDSFFVAATSTVALLVYPWYAWMSSTPMLDEYYLAAILAGLFYGAVWEFTGERPRFVELRFPSFLLQVSTTNHG